MKYFIAALIMFLSITASAEDKCTTWGCISTLNELYTKSSGVVYIATPLDETKANCTPHSGVYFTLRPEVSGYKEIYSSLLAAYMSDKKIQLRITEGTIGCEINYVRFAKGF